MSSEVERLQPKTQSVREFLDSFDRLTASERREALPQIWKRAEEFGYPPLTDEELARIADETFRSYDAEEAAVDRG